MLATTAIVIMCFTFLDSSSPSEDIICGKHKLISLVDLKFVNLNKLISPTPAPSRESLLSTASIPKLSVNSKMKQKEILSLVDLKFVNLERTINETPSISTLATTSATPSPSKTPKNINHKCECLATFSSLDKRDVSGIPVYSRGLPVIVIQSRAYDIYLNKNSNAPMTKPTNHGSEDKGNEKCDCSNDKEEKRIMMLLI